MRRVLGLLCTVGCATGAAWAHSDLSMQVSVELTADRQVYYVGEPVRLTLVVKNDSSFPVFGRVLLEPYLPDDLKTAELLYCRETDPCTEFLGKIPRADELDMMVSSIQLDPAQSQRSTFVVALNPKTGRLVLNRSGDYAFQWRTWGIRERTGVSARVRGREFSANAHISVLPVPESEREASEYYAGQGLAELAQFDPAYSIDRPELRRAALSMIEQYPESRYTRAIHDGLRNLLRLRAQRGNITPREREILDALLAQHHD